MSLKQQEILLIDDDPIVNFLHKEVIQTKCQGLSLKTFENGLLALEYIKEHPQLHFLIFLDINMPVMNGWEFLEALSREEDKYNTNIHILTSSVDRSDEQKAQQFSRVKSYLTKPLTKNQLEENDNIFPAN